ncbi:TPR end-of-group domain-containing protein [Endozoicomonas ascidiicola]|uniref:TPR end-of-group domain-containing protein n=1 Tax=Endozoicomonas ascidiicola TaxID=1698521 RepID=UPI000A77E220|nr:tetratricopeptide repeat protein [Endozoicomonas ascidiicola]
MPRKSTDYVIGIFFWLAFSVLPVNAATQPTTAIDEPLYKPFIERYILDELKLLRQDQQFMRTEMTTKVAEARLDASDRAVRYTTDTVNNIFFIITAAASILVLLGWRSLREVRETIKAQVESQVSQLTLEYERRLNELENKLVLRSEQIISAQEKISQTNQVHSLWMRSGLETNLHEQINIYDQILEIYPNDVEALTYKADSLLDLGEARWALSLSNQAIEHDQEYALAYWQRACAEASLGQLDEAVSNLETAILKSPALKDEVATEKAFEVLKDNLSFQKLVDAEGEE